MIGRHPLGLHDLILPAGVIVAGHGYFYTGMVMLFVWGWLNKRRAIRFREQQNSPGESAPMAKRLP